MHKSEEVARNLHKRSKHKNTDAFSLLFFSLCFLYSASEMPTIVMMFNWL